MSAIGPDDLDRRFAGSTTARLFRGLVGTYGMSFEVRRADDLTLPAAREPQLRFAVTTGRARRLSERHRPGPPERPLGRPVGRSWAAGRTIHVLGPYRPTALRRWPMIAVLALIAGVVLGVVVEPTVPVALQPYLPIAVVAALDAVFGGIRAKLDGIFDDKQFVISFISNVLVAGVIVYLGDQLGVGGQLSTGVVVVLGVRIFGNVAAIRRHLFRA